MDKLNPQQVKNLSVPGPYEDGQGLRLVVAASGSKSWVLRYQVQGKRREMGLGGYPGLSLAGARLAAAAQRKLLASGVDPMAARDAERECRRQELARSINFETLTADYIAAHGAHWSAQWQQGWRSKMERYVFPTLGKLAAADIHTEQILKVLQPIWAAKTRTADEVRNHIERVLDAAKSRKLRDGDNPARWRGHLENLLSKADKKKARRREHLPAMNWRDLPALMQQLARRDDRDVYALRLLILTGARSHMVRFAAWSEFDLAAAVWSLPADRMKMREAFEIPLAPQVIELLRAMPRTDGSQYLFPGQGRNADVMGDRALLTLLERLNLNSVTVHGFRSTFRDWANERTHYPREVCELALAHDERTQTEAAYSRSDLLEKRRALMNDWAAYATTAPSENVIQGDFKRA
ncbi:tyrosine-type recombinase/integrase [Pseudomonas peli]|uniref:tyrosine-type recombinase/integrase n=1 Tax=Pseudomonas peli TaxID=592361 RepID=UPI0035B50C69